MSDMDFMYQTPPMGTGGFWAVIAKQIIYEDHRDRLTRQLLAPDSLTLQEAQPRCTTSRGPLLVHSTATDHHS